MSENVYKVFKVRATPHYSAIKWQRIRGFLKWYALYKSTFYLLTYLLYRYGQYYSQSKLLTDCPVDDITVSAMPLTCSRALGRMQVTFLFQLMCSRVSFSIMVKISVKIRVMVRFYLLIRLGCLYTVDKKSATIHDWEKSALGSAI